MADKYEKTKLLGRGSYGSAWLVRRRDSGEKFVVKQIDTSRMNPAEVEEAEREALLLSRMSHSNVVEYVESFVERRRLHIVMGYADGGDLAGVLQQRKAQRRPLDEVDAMRFFVQCCLALRHVHQRHILHRDLKPANIFLTMRGVVKLGDFGVAKVLDNTAGFASTQIGTPYYLSPELCNSERYGVKSDVWSLGCVLYEMLALHPPFEATTLPALVGKIVAPHVAPPPLPGALSRALLALVDGLLRKRPQDRLGMDAVVALDVFRRHVNSLLSHTERTGKGGSEHLCTPQDASDDHFAAADASDTDEDEAAAKPGAPGGERKGVRGFRGGGGAMVKWQRAPVRDVRYERAP